MSRRKVSADNFNISFFKNVADVAFGPIIHTLPLYAPRNAYPLYIPVCGTGCGERGLKFIL